MALLLVVIAPATFELVEYAVVLVQDAQLIPQVVVHRISLDRPILHVQVPYFYVQVVACAHVATRMAELHVRYTAYYLREEVLRRRVFSLFEYFRQNNNKKLIIK